jgi:hypothetical protein
MRIKSTFHDYYDSVQSMGQDHSLLYLRMPKEVELKESPFPFIKHLRHWGGIDIVAARYVIGFCGKIYPVLEMQHPSKSEIENVFCFNVAQVDKYLEANFKPDSVKRYRAGKRWYDPYWTYTRRGSVESFFAECLATQEKYSQLFTVNCCPVWIYKFRHGTSIMTYNGRLRDVEFYRMFDTYSAYQEISMYLGNLAAPEKPLPKIDDKTMAEIKGFDKFSFRKDKKK